VLSTADQFEALWQRVSGLKPALRSDVQIHAHEFRGARWHVIQDHSSTRYCRINDVAYEFVGRLDGNHSVDEVLELINRGSHASGILEPIEAVRIMAQLHEIEVLKGGIPLGLSESLTRYSTNQRRKFSQRWSNPLAIKLPLIDPDSLLNSMAPLGRLMFSAAGLLIWFAILAIGILVSILHLDTLTTEVANLTIQVPQILMIGLLYPFMKALHELGHGLAIKAWGGEVHEAGIMFLLFMPVPYVDASSSLGFRDRRKRAVVAGAGILVELLLATIGLGIWLISEPGIINAIAFNMFLIGSVSTLLYNGNPLLRFDGYFVLEDVLQIPNLAMRAAKYYLYLIQRYALRLTDSVTPVTAAGERRWFLLYGLLSPIYRIVILFGIALYLSHHYMLVGVVLACWAVFVQIGKPLYRVFKFLFTSKRLYLHRTRAITGVLLLVLACLGALWVPVPLISRVEGVVWLNEDSTIYAKEDGIVDSSLVSSGALVSQGEPVMKLQNTELKLDLLKARLTLAELQTKQYIAQEESRNIGKLAIAEIEPAKAEVVDLEKRVGSLDVVSSMDGRLVLKDPHTLTGKFIKSGDVLAYVIASQPPLIRAVIDQNRVHLMQRKPLAAEVMLADQTQQVYTALLEHQVPAGTNILPSKSLGMAGGGKIPVDLSDSNGTTATREVYLFDLRLPENATPFGVGSKAYIRLSHGKEPLAVQWARNIKQLLLERLPN